MIICKPHSIGSISHLVRRRHRRHYPTQPVNKAAFLIDAQERRYLADVSDVIQQFPRLCRLTNISRKQANSTGGDLA
ncbi:MAG: hypothetical protein IPK98_13530 [Chloracidobacterium sp.]|nr:hypothetical protein [Chloracidobacterium sp.]